MALSQVLVAFGRDHSLNYPFTSELYNPATGTWATTGGSANVQRYAHAMVKLSNGRVLAAGGEGLSNAGVSCVMIHPYLKPNRSVRDFEK